MKKMLAAGALALMTVAGSAQAAPTITFNGGSGALPTGSTVIQNFESFAANSSIGTNAFAFNTSSGLGFRPAFGSTGNFGAVLDGGSYSIAFAATNLFSFVVGSLDSFNQLTLNLSDGTTASYVDGMIVNNPALFDSGSRTDAQTNGVVSYSATNGQLITGATFSSRGGNSFEFDNLAVGGAVTSVPEPAAWGMMILGFALVGGVLRRRSSAKVRFAY